MQAAHVRLSQRNSTVFSRCADALQVSVDERQFFEQTQKLLRSLFRADVRVCISLSYSISFKLLISYCAYIRYHFHMQIIPSSSTNHILYNLFSIITNLSYYNYFQ